MVEQGFGSFGEAICNFKLAVYVKKEILCEFGDNLDFKRKKTFLLELIFPQNQSAKNNHSRRERERRRC